MDHAGASPQIDEEEIFAIAGPLPPAERAAYLARACAGRSTALVRIERLLRLHDDGEFMGIPAERTAAPSVKAELARLKPEEPGE